MPRRNRDPLLERIETLGDIHNFSNFIGAILSRTELLLSKMKDSDLVADIEAIRSAAKEAVTIANRLQSPKPALTVKKDWVNLNELITTVIEMVKPKCLDSSGRPKILIRFETSPIPKIYGWSSLLLEALLNLLLNAIEAISQQMGGEIAIHTFVDGDWLKIRVSDSGIGMSDETLRSLFKPFFTTKKENGHGLGLASSQKIVKKHGGFIEVESAARMGTRALISLPIPHPFQRKKRSVRGRKVMLIDDEKDYREATAELLSLQGYEVEQAANGFEALKKLKRNNFDIILSDLEMPKPSGSDLLKKIKARNKNTKVIFVSGYSNQKAIKADGWLTKPCLFEDISEVIRKTCH